ncbi:hypothetical protein A9Z42_0004510 [Trichoderma parareesei]|uniref:Uncharacterized protein n=1 Tax=Trichoderma parareesei TaxID=858221 RepID=A0A2H3A3Z7_TRIPA|nr:hypothetical protein A9Z42_0004510 [Trichoderma parareesei]
MASRPRMRELKIADLRLNEDDEHFADGVACVRLYWSQASQMTVESQEVMIELDVNRDYAHTDWSRKQLSNHRLYRTSTGRDDVSAWPVFLILNALYKELSLPYLAVIEERNLPTALEDHTEDYLASLAQIAKHANHLPQTRAGSSSLDGVNRVIGCHSEKAIIGVVVSLFDVVVSGSLSSLYRNVERSRLRNIVESAVTASLCHNAIDKSLLGDVFSDTHPVSTTTPTTSVTATTLPQVSLSTNLTRTPAPRAPAATMTATPSTSTETVIQPQSMQPSVDTLAGDADVDSAPSARNKRGPPTSIPAMSTKRQNTNQGTFEGMIQSLQSPATVSAKPKPSATDAISKLEQRVDVLENQVMAVLVAMTNEIKVLKEKVAMLEDV